MQVAGASNTKAINEVESQIVRTLQSTSKARVTITKDILKARAKLEYSILEKATNKELIKLEPPKHDDKFSNS